MAKVYVTRRATFSASHRLHSDQLSAAENQKIFGKCNHPSGHGHNYTLEVTLAGTPDPKTGIFVNLVDVKDVIESEVMKRVDHRHLNLDVPEFQKLVPTAENIAIVIWNWLKPKLSDLVEVKITETENNFAYYRGE